MARFDHLQVLWQAPDDGSRFAIGDLWRERDGTFAFAYRSDVTEAEHRGFSGLTEFPQRRDDTNPYRSRYLFATFAQRIPSPKRVDFSEIIAAWGIEHGDDPLEILARSGGIQMTDRLELAEFRSEDDDLVEPLEFRIAGMRHYGGAAERLEPGQRLTLRRENANEYDRSATLVVSLDDDKLGHVPRQYSTLVARHLDAGHALEAHATRRLSTPADPNRWIVSVRRAA